MFISEALALSAETAAETANVPASDGTKILVQCALIFFILYIFMIRPQLKRAKQHQAELNAIIKGCKINVNGIIGTVTDVKEDVLTVEIAPDTEITVMRPYVSGLIIEKEKGK